jgi:hypothetical protein
MDGEIQFESQVRQGSAFSFRINFCDKKVLPAYAEHIKSNLQSKKL